MTDALRALNRAEEALAISGHVESQFNSIIADNRYLETANTDLSRRLAEVERQMADLAALVLSLVGG